VGGHPTSYIFIYWRRNRELASNRHTYWCQYWSVSFKLLPWSSTQTQLRHRPNVTILLLYFQILLRPITTFTTGRVGATLSLIHFFKIRTHIPYNTPHLFYSFSTFFFQISINMSHFTERIGQAHIFSHLCHKLPHYNPSIITRLRPRRLSGQSVYHHFGYHLHLTWQCINKLTKNRRFGVECRFLSYASIYSFCNDLQTLDNLSSCVSERWPLPLLTV
jgi:hypothetical protein